jgi:1-Cys peroxiredoxin 6
MAQLGKVFPDFEAETTQGRISFHEWLGDSWGILFSHPADYTPVCTTELARVVDYTEKFAARNVKMIALSCDSVEDHLGWSKDVESFNARGGKVKKDLTFPIIADPDRKLAVKFGMLDPDEIDAQGIPLPARAVFIVGSDKKLKLSILYPATTGRNFDEIIRVIDSLQLTATKKVATPVDWKAGDRCMVLPNIPPAEAKDLFPEHETVNLPSGKVYLRLTPQP